MRYRTGLVLIVVLATVSSTAAGAHASSPTILLLAGEAFPVELRGPTDSPNNGIKAELQNAAGVLKREGMLLAFVATSASSGTFNLMFLRLMKGTLTCNTPGDEPGVMLVPEGNFALVHDISSTEGIGILFTINEFTVECGTTKIKIKGTILGLLLPAGGGEKTTGFGLKVHCSVTVGEPSETKFWNAAGSEETALVLENFGTGFKKACLEITTEVPLASSKMLELMN